MRVSLGDKVVIVTGASRGLGAATAEAFARRGARVAVVARSREALQEVASRMGDGLVCPADVRDGDQIDETVKRVLKRWGRIDVLVNGAGVKLEGPVEFVAVDDVMDALSTNYVGALRFCQAVLPAMREGGGGHIINVSSVLGKRATPQRGAYSASKAALNALTDAMRVELRDAGVAVTLVCPGRLSDAGADGASRFAMSNERAANLIVGCAERPRREMVLTFAGRVLCGLNCVAPRLVDRILGRVRRGDR